MEAMNNFINSNESLHYLEAFTNYLKKYQIGIFCEIML